MLAVPRETFDVHSMSLLTFLIVSLNYSTLMKTVSKDHSSIATASKKTEWVNDFISFHRIFPS